MNLTKTNMALSNSPGHLVFKIDESKKSYEKCFPGLMFSSSDNPVKNCGLQEKLSKALDELKPKDLIGSLNITDNIGVKVINDQAVTPKSQKQKPDVKRWASVVKAQKKVQHSNDLDVNDNHNSENVENNSEIFDCIFKTFPKSFESHKSFFVINDKMFYCNICLVNLDSVLSLSNHLKTRKHEDKAIEYFKTKMPTHLHHIMEFVSFYGSSLCCNLCHCDIPMSSLNPHETIVNIIAHNNDDSHISKKVNHDTGSSTETVLQALSASSDIIKENLHFVESRVVPEFRCQLCKVKIPFEDNQEVLSQNFVMHMKSQGHIKNQKAVEVLRLFGEASIAGKDNWVVVNGSIMCTYCNKEFETNLQQLVSHVNEMEHAANVLFKLNINSNFNKVSEKSTVQENIMNEAKSIVLKNKGDGDGDQPKLGGSRLKELLSTMPPALRDVDYVIENEKGSVTCLICNRVVPPSTYNLRTHLLGSKHKTNMETRAPAPKVNKESNKAVFEASRPVAKLEAKNGDHNSNVPSRPMNIASIVSNKFGYVLKKDNFSVMCMLCQFSGPSHSFETEHLMSSEHKKRENEWLKNCPGCSSTNPFTFKVLTALPTSIRTYKCRRMETIPASVLNHLYSLLLDENQLVKNNEKVIVKNVDGKHCYCKLCKTLIPLSLDLDILENNLVDHFKGKRHEGFTTKQKSTKDASTSPNVARSLFELPENLEKLPKNSKVFNFDEFSRLMSKDSEKKTSEDEIKSCEENVLGSKSEEGQNQNDSQNEKQEAIADSITGKVNNVFVFGKEDSNNVALKDSEGGSDKIKSHNSKALPVGSWGRLVKFEEETSEDVLKRRQKQIEYGKNTAGYARYCSLVPRRKRSCGHPVTPPRHLRCSRRTWDGMIHAWRRQLHAWDPPSTVESDIRPLD
ncbi:uncharacterized protein LOC128986662 isoform X1 [Macrosteles quadrilineatus]|uniref:uncharacterized protein LOC128986662 isoform X1 n=1 Tax=Macrosteles quadrilineatus TaxID=74068 RepID=UPI0023E2E852|nr:uncharacterized protein LOC128986662 isoform X1 [Macrosteles quadrilineatus]